MKREIMVKLTEKEIIEIVSTYIVYNYLKDDNMKLISNYPTLGEFNFIGGQDDATTVQEPNESL